MPNRKKYRKTDRLAGAGLATFLLSSLLGGFAFFLGSAELVSASFFGLASTCAIMGLAFHAIPSPSSSGSSFSEDENNHASPTSRETIEKFAVEICRLERVCLSVDGIATKRLLADIADKSRKILAAIREDERRVLYARRFVEYYLSRAVLFAESYADM